MTIEHFMVAHRQSDGGEQGSPAQSDLEDSVRVLSPYDNFSRMSRVLRPGVGPIAARNHTNLVMSAHQVRNEAGEVAQSTTNRNGPAACPEPTVSPTPTAPEGSFMTAISQRCDTYSSRSRLRCAAWHPLPTALTALTLVNGLVHAINHLGLGHIRTADTTGTAVSIGFAAVGVPVFSLLASGFPRVVGTALATETLLLSAATAAAVEAPGHMRFALIASRALVMGVRMGEARRAAVADMPMTAPTTMPAPALPSG
jgi:hypothetical protein